MSSALDITLGRRRIGLHVYTGEVVGDRKWATTDVSSTRNNYGSVSSIHSSTTTHDQVFLRAEDGSEQAAQFSDLHLAVRPGHRVSLVWGIRASRSSGPYLAVHNHTLGETSYIRNAIYTLAGPLHPAVRWLLIIAAALTGYAFLGEGVDPGGDQALATYLTGLLFMAFPLWLLYWLVRGRHSGPMSPGVRRTLAGCVVLLGLLYLADGGSPVTAGGFGIASWLYYSSVQRRRRLKVEIRRVCDAVQPATATATGSPVASHGAGNPVSA